MLYPISNILAICNSKFVIFNYEGNSTINAKKLWQVVFEKNDEMNFIDISNIVIE